MVYFELTPENRTYSTLENCPLKICHGATEIAQCFNVLALNAIQPSFRTQHYIWYLSTSMSDIPEHR